MIRIDVGFELKYRDSNINFANLHVNSHVRCLTWPTLLITSGRALYTMFPNNYVDGSNCRLVNNGWCFGQTWNDDAIFIYSRNYADQKDTPVSVIKKSAETKDVKNSALKKLSSSHCIKSGHQLLWNSHDSLLYATCTENDKIVAYNVDGHIEKVYSFAIDGHKNSQHINSLWFDAENTLWSVFHRNTHKTGNDSIIVRIDDEGTIIERHEQFGRCSHNVYVEDDRIITLSSLTNEIMIKDKKTNDVRVVACDPKREHLSKYLTWLRGLVRVEGSYIVGISTWTTTNLDRIQQRDKINETYLCMFDDDFALKDIRYLGKLGTIYDIHAIDRPDSCHNDITFPFMSTT